MNSAPPVHPASAGDHARQRSLATQLFLSLRPTQWTKNLPVFAGVAFAQKLRDPHAVLASVVAFGVFCLLSGVVYLVNDVRDRAADQVHPVKCRRPIASGAVSPQAAMVFALSLATAALFVAFRLSVPFGVVGATYLTLNTLYSFSLKHVVILDVLTIAIGFVLRALGGAVAIDVSFSHWLLLLTLLLALFLGLSKRRAEVVALAGDAAKHRRILAEYTPYLLDQMISVVTASTLLAYAFYTIDPVTEAKFGTDRLIWTIPFPLYGIFRYLYLVHRQDGGGNPSETLLTDRPLLACVALWGVAMLGIIYGHAGPIAPSR